MRHCCPGRSFGILVAFFGVQRFGNNVCKTAKGGGIAVGKEK